MAAEGLSHADRVVGGLVLALHGETGLTALDLNALEALLAESQAELLPFLAPEGGFRNSVERLASAGQVEIDRSNPHVRVTLAGYLNFFSVEVPSQVAAIVASKLSGHDLA